MADYGYYKRTRGLFDPLRHGLGHALPKEPFRLSRSKIDLFWECPRCFYLDRRLGVPRPSLPGFTLNIAVDHLLKKEFDTHRAKGDPHPLMTEYKIDAVPFAHKKLDVWRNNFKGVERLHTPTNFLVFGAIDDVWVNPKGELHVVDYKATSKAEKPDLEGFWQQVYKRQMEVYQWLMRGNGFEVSDTGYFVYVNGRKDAEAFDGKLEFDVDIIPYTGDDGWVERTLLDAQKALEADVIPEAGQHCEYCPYRQYAGESIRETLAVHTRGEKQHKQKKGGQKETPF
ncbi:PD-(D/E)XK nuclease family protein [Candidatus Wolfebacteria bacterium]|nr:PD-(D/E)XK nuclease family protein [Candidatus Wolfebacteria bacterium]